jgi:oligoribonuclease NrnB/cAMP/cGMP phosphodiesterase (DHH superfamily)
MFHVYSHNDLDGVSCGILAKCAFGKDVEVRYNSVESLNTQVQRYLERFAEKGGRDDLLLITDLSVNKEIEHVVNRFSEAGGSVKLIDHHKTALHFNEYQWAAVIVQYDDGRLASATSLFYEYLVQKGWLTQSTALDEYVELVRQYDTWEWDQNDNVQAKRLNDLFFLVSIDEFEEKMVTRLQQSEHFFFDEFEEKILDMEEGKIERYVRRKRREVVQTFIDDRCAGIVHAESYHSELGNELGKENPHLDYIAILNVGGRRVSFRTIHDETDVSQIAGQYGGGGHAKASGCSMTEDVFRLYVAEAFRLEPMRLDAFRNMHNLKASRYGTLYEGRKDARFFVYPHEDEWIVERNGERMDETFASFEQAERLIKRNHAAWLVRDDVFVRFLAEQTMAARNG